MLKKSGFFLRKITHDKKITKRNDGKNRIIYKINKMVEIAHYVDGYAN